MITLPPGFNINLLFSDFLKLSLPFVGIALMFAAGYYIRRIMRSFR